MRQGVVAHFLEGKRLVKGFTHDFFPTKEIFHIERIDGPEQEVLEAIPVKQLKALFFVKSFEGNPDHKEQPAEEVPEGRIGKKVEIEFIDGEKIMAICESYNPTKPGFFAFPLDPESNNEKIFVVNSSVRRVTFFQ